MPNFNAIVNKVLKRSDIVLEVLDARFIDETRNKGIEENIKILIHVINKCDLVEKSYLDSIKKELENCVFVSAREYLGTTLLKQKIRMLANKNKIKKPIIGVIGYPNVGKSSIINALKGKSSAGTSPEAGYTRALQYLRVGRDFLLIDTPGVISKGKTKDDDLVLIGAKNPATIEDPDLAAMKLIKSNPRYIEKKYKIVLKKDPEETIKLIALKGNMKKKGNLPDVERASIKILHDWINGKK